MNELGEEGKKNYMSELKWMAAIVDLNYLIQLAEFSFENTKLELRSGFVVGEQMQKKQTPTLIEFM